MKLKNKLLATFSFLLISISISQANETFSNKITNFYGIDEFPLLPGEYNFINAEMITTDGKFIPVNDFNNSNSLSSIQGELRTGSFDSFVADENSIRLNFAILQKGDVETINRKSFYSCNEIRNIESVVSTNIEVFNDNSFIESCTFKNIEFNFAAFFYTQCFENCVEIQYYFFLSQFNDISNESLNELGVRMYINIDRALNGDYGYDLEFINSYIK